MFQVKYPLGFLGPLLKWDFRSGGRLGAGWGASEVGLSCASGWWSWDTLLGWSGAYGAVHHLTRARPDLTLPSHLKYFKPEFFPVSHTGTAGFNYAVKNDCQEFGAEVRLIISCISQEFSSSYLRTIGMFQCGQKYQDGKLFLGTCNVLCLSRIVSLGMFRHLINFRPYVERKIEQLWTVRSQKRVWCW